MNFNKEHIINVENFKILFYFIKNKNYKFRINLPKDYTLYGLSS